MTAGYWVARPDGTVSCRLCPHACVISEGKIGLCGARRCQEGALEAESYGHVTALALDPIEKKPLRRFMPGSMILSLGSYGCNLRCPFCQNYEIATACPPSESYTPEEVAALSLRVVSGGNIGVAYTYNEPLVGYEFVRDCAQLIRRQGQKNVLVTNGFVEETPWRALLADVDAVNIDLKCFQPSGYRALGGYLEPVKRAIVLAAGLCHVEVTVLVVPGLNDDTREITALFDWLAGVDENIPLHISRFFPHHRMAHTPPTPVERIFQLADCAGRRLRHVYTGNV